MKMNKKGFTLIELLAVIVILAVIALIAVPQILNILNNARRSASEDSAYGILQAAETYAATYMLDHHGDALLANTTFNCTRANGCVIDESTLGEGIEVPTNKKLSFKGTIPSEGKIILDEEGKATIVDASPLKINNFYCNDGVESNKDIVKCDIDDTKVKPTPAGA